MRILIASDEEGKWRIRRIASVIHDGHSDSMMYHCDTPLGEPAYESLSEAAIDAARLQEEAKN